MLVEYQQITEIVNDLATINRERAKAYEEASFLNFIFNLELRGSFALLANQSRQNSFSLRQYLEQLPVSKPGKKPLPQLTFGDLYNQWKNMGISFSGPNIYDMLTSSEQGEEAIQVIYNKAIELLPQGHQLLYLLENQLRGLHTSHSIVKGILNHPQKMPQRIKKSS